MAAEHCTMGGCDYEFTYPLLITTTTPRQEWFHVVSFNGGQHLHQSDMSNGRRLLDPSPLFKTQVDFYKLPLPEAGECGI